MSDVEHDLVMPFVVCRSNGGPYDDDGFCAGWHLGQIDTELAVVAPAILEVTVLTGSVPQLDLIAMRRGYAIDTQVSDDVPEWAFVRLTKAAG